MPPQPRSSPAPQASAMTPYERFVSEQQKKQPEQSQESHSSSQANQQEDFKIQDFKTEDSPFQTNRKIKDVSELFNESEKAESSQ